MEWSCDGSFRLGVRKRFFTKSWPGTEQAPQGSSHGPEPDGVQAVFGQRSQIPGLIFTQSCMQPRVRLSITCKSLPTREILCFSESSMHCILDKYIPNHFLYGYPFKDTHLPYEFLNNFGRHCQTVLEVQRLSKPQLILPSSLATSLHAQESLGVHVVPKSLTATHTLQHFPLTEVHCHHSDQKKSDLHETVGPALAHR